MLFLINILLQPVSICTHVSLTGGDPVRFLIKAVTSVVKSDTLVSSTLCSFLLRGIEFQPMEPNPSQRFVEYCTSTARSRRQQIGLQCSPIDVNTPPIRAWREIFKNTLLDKIVRYTNEYGLLHSKRWKDISKKDLESFFAFLFILGIQKRKDKPSNWFSNN
jgi:Transposase IS4